MKTIRVMATTRKWRQRDSREIRSLRRLRGMCENLLDFGYDMFTICISLEVVHMRFHFLDH